MGSMCVCCVCECLWPVCKCVFVYVSLLVHILWLWGWTGRGEEHFFLLRISGSGVQVGSITMLLPIAVGALWKQREFVCWVRRQSCVVSPERQIACLDRSEEFVFNAGAHKRRSCFFFYFLFFFFFFFTARNGHNCLFLCERDLTVLLTGSSKCVIVPKQISSLNGKRQTWGALLSGQQAGCCWIQMGSLHLSSISCRHRGQQTSVTAFLRLIWPA